MKKDAFYFPHDSNAKDDPKCTLLIEELGLEGYGIFWILIEILRDQPNYKYPLKLLPAIARRYNTTHEKIKAVVLRYELFIVENESFIYSNSLNERMHAANMNRINGIKGSLLRYGHAKKEQLDKMTDSQIIDLHEVIKNNTHSPLPSPLPSPPLALERKGKERKGNKIKNNILLSEIEISDVPEEIKKYYEVALSFQKLIIKNCEEINYIGHLNKVKKAKFMNWLTPIRLIYETDKYDNEHIKKAYNNLKNEKPNGEFAWKKVILSTENLRKHFDRLLNIDNNPKINGSQPQVKAQTLKQARKL